MDGFLICFSIICFLLAVLASFILFFVNKEQVFCNRLIGLVILLFGLQNLISFLVFSGLMIKIPHIYRVLGPTTLLILPLSYIYVRAVLKSETSFRKSDWILLIPSVLYAVNLAPVYFLPYEDKLILVRNYLANPRLQGQFNEGILPPYVLLFIRTIWSTVFLIMLFNSLRQFKKNVDNKILEINKDLLQWLTNFSYVLLALVSVFIIHAIIAPIFKLDTKIGDYTLVFAVFILTSILFAKPRVLYGLYLPTSELKFITDYDPKIDNTSEKNTEVVGIHVLDKQKYLKKILENQEYKEAIEQFFRANLPFLNPNYSLDNLVDDLKIPKHTLSSFINQEYGMGFRKFLNSKRVEYLLENYKKPEWKNHTLEAIANESGFKNRSTFILNFREFTQKKPLEYFKDKA
ncbi:helix-turn-helix domain-containing protein [Flavobacterium buctense]|uniref:Helix-turn-helix domain-containing protein n=1 Tax=Flavobacterium buctense TaxID=1648146 RepID=A0ABU9E2D1_9FLAO|nr:helix-turn-helix domain-containing protein [Flavobacterium buctense]